MEEGRRKEERVGRGRLNTILYSHLITIQQQEEEEAEVGGWEEPNT